MIDTEQLAEHIKEAIYASRTIPDITSVDLPKDSDLMYSGGELVAASFNVYAEYEKNEVPARKVWHVQVTLVEDSTTND